MEPVDMLRKLALSGLLQFVERGTAAQVLLGCCLAFGSFGLQVRLMPYRERSANVLKTAAELVLFLTFLISFILRVLPRIEAYEPLTADTYGWVLVAAFGSFVALAVGLTAKQNWERRRFRSGLADFAGGSFTETGGGGGCDGMDAGLLTRGPSSLTSSHQTANPLELAGAASDPSPPSETKLEPEPEPEPGPRQRGGMDRLYRAVAEM